MEEDSGEEDGPDDDLDDIGISRSFPFLYILHMVSPYNSLSPNDS